MSKRLYKLVSGYPGICRILIKSQKSGEYVEPKRGARFRADKYVKDQQGRPRRKFAFVKSFADAKSFRKQTIEPIEDIPKPSQGILFSDLVQEWRESWLPNRNISTQIRYRSYLAHFAFFMELRVEEIEPKTIDRWIALVKNPEYLAAGHSTRCTYNHEFSVLKGILNFYSSRFNRNYRLPFIKDHKSMLKVRERPRSVKDLNVSEFRNFLDCLREVCRKFDCEVIYYLAGMQYALYARVQEAAALHSQIGG